jgi:hypothetical protein
MRNNLSVPQEVLLQVTESLLLQELVKTRLINLGFV